MLIKSTPSDITRTGDPTEAIVIGPLQFTGEHVHTFGHGHGFVCVVRFECVCVGGGIVDENLLSLNKILLPIWVFYCLRDSDANKCQKYANILNKVYMVPSKAV